VFLDRDGTINADTHFPYRTEDLEFVPGAVEGLKQLAKLPLDIIVVSNQAGIALGLFTRAQMSEFNAELRSRVEAFGARIDAFYFCPHLACFLRLLGTLRLIWPGVSSSATRHQTLRPGKRQDALRSW
jgi:histidinol-phosphate phosphatase family protein